MSEKTRKRLINPFVFPAETDARFILFIAAAILLAVNQGFWLSFTLELVGTEDYVQDVPVPDLDAQGEAYLMQVLAFEKDVLTDEIKLWVFPVGFAGVMGTLALILYRTHPGRVRRKKKFSPLEQEKDTMLLCEIENLTERTGLPPFQVEVGKGFRSANAQVFGFRMGYILGLDGGLRVQLLTAAELFRAKVLHELAHIVNHDVVRTYFSEALWIAVLSMTIIPILLGFCFFQTVFVLQRLVQIAMVIYIVGYIRASLLLVREYYADWRAAIWGAKETLVTLLKRDQESKKLMRQGRRKIQIFRLHPSSKERLTTLENSLRLFRLSRDYPFLLGILIAFVIEGVIRLDESLSLVPNSVFSIGLIEFTNLTRMGSEAVSIVEFIIVYGSIIIFWVTDILPYLVIAWLVTATLGLQIQRKTIAELIAGRGFFASIISLFIPAFLLGIGVEAGFLITPFDELFQRGLADIYFTTFLFISLILVVWLCLVYLNFWGRILFGSNTGKNVPNGKRRFLSLSFGGFLWLFTMPVLSARMHVGLDYNPVLETTFWWRNLLVVLVVFTIFILFSFLTWCIVMVKRVVRRPRCLHCNTPQKRAVMLGELCTVCQQPLAPWLYIQTG